MTGGEGHGPSTASCQEKNGQQQNTRPQHEYPLIKDRDLRIPRGQTDGRGWECQPSDF